MLSLLTPAPPRLIPTPPQTVQTVHRDVCVHTRLTDEVEDWKIERSLEMVRDMGASTIVEFLPWAYVEHSPGQYDWGHPDRIIDTAQHEGLTVIARLGLVPAWARPDPNKQPTTQNYLSPDRFPDYARYVAAFAARYRGKVNLIIPWNEPNLGVEWGGTVISPAGYVDFLKQVYTAAHAANPDVIILGGALAPTIEPLGSPNGTDDLVFLRELYKAGWASYFDALAVHTYGLTSAPEAPPDPQTLNFRRFEQQLDIMRAAGDGQKPVYITESGWNDHPRWSLAVRPGQRVAYTIDALKWVENHDPAVHTLCFWFFRAPTLTRSYPDYFSFVTVEFYPRPIYTAVQAYARGWNQP
jgi:hypothetical protein